MDHRHFDPVTASATMRTLAAFAEPCATSGTALERGFLRNAMAELRRAQAWRDARLAELELPARLPLVRDQDGAEWIGAAALAYTLRYAADEMAQVLDLVERRGVE
jgi:hypothetical protein